MHPKWLLKPFENFIYWNFKIDNLIVCFDVK